MKTSARRIPLADMTAMLDACGPSPEIETIRVCISAPGADLIQLARRIATEEGVVFRAFEHYAFHEGGVPLTSSARNHHWAFFYRYFRKVFPNP